MTDSVLKIAPKPQLAIVATLLAACIWLFIAVALQEPSLGLRWQAPAAGEGLIVSRVISDGPADGRVHAGSRMLSIASPSGATQLLSARTLLEEPDYLATWDELNEFYVDQNRLNKILHDKEVVLSFENGKQARLQPTARHLIDLPFLFWFQIMCGVTAVLTAVTVWTFQPSETHTRYFALSGLSLLLITFPSAVYAGRELALPAPLFQILAGTDHLGAMSFIGAIPAMLWLYPHRLTHSNKGHWFLALMLLFWAGDVTRVLPSPPWGIHLPVALSMTMLLILVLLQVRHARTDPIARAVVRWFGLSILVGVSLYFGSITLAVHFGGSPLIPQGYAFGFVTTLFIGIALGIARYRLFELERWWLSIWLWAFTGAGIIFADLTLAYLLRVESTFALSISLAIAGWLYFPIRQWVLARFARKSALSTTELLPDVIDLALASHSKFEIARGWRRLLERTFEPMAVTQLEGPTPKETAILDYGRALSVPGVAGVPSLELSLPSRGHRLFGPPDQKLTASLLQMVTHALSRRDDFNAGTLAERERIARDLHDDVGTRLLALAHQAEDGPLASAAREALQDLRLVVSSIGGSPCWLGDALADWRQETTERCEAANVTLDWEQGDIPPSVMLDTKQRYNLLRILRESLANALKHAHPHSISVKVTFSTEGLVLVLEDDGDAPPPEDWVKGRGLRNIEHRLKELGATVIRSSISPTGTRLRYTTPLQEEPA